MLGKITLPESTRSSTQFQNQEKMEQLEIITRGVAHDFNNLLTSILGQSSLALKQLPDDNVARHHIEKAIQAAEYAALLTRQLLTYARNGSSEASAVDLNRLVNDNAGLLQTVFMQDIDLKMELASNLPLLIASPGEVQQVVMNLMINAAEAIQSESGSITLRTGKIKRLPDNRIFQSIKPNHSLREYIYIQVSDTGIGMDSATIDRIFEPFFTTKPDGKGIGLSAVHNIVDTYQGEISIESKVGHGTTITVFFPRQEERAYQQPLH